MKRPLYAALLALSLVSTSGCATLFANAPSELAVTVPGAGDRATTIVRGVMNDRQEVHHEASFKTELDKGSPYAVSISRDGYEPQLYIVKMEVNPYYWGNYLPVVVALGASVTSPNMDPNLRGTLAMAGVTWMLIGPLVDILTKAAYRHDLHAIDAQLVKKAPPEPASR